MSSAIDPSEYSMINKDTGITALIELILVAIRQGIFFGIETRVPYAITSILRPKLFNKPGRPILKSLKFFAEQSIAHGWIIARIAVIFKLSEKLLASISQSKKPEPWHSFVAGAFAGYLIMARDKSYGSMKKQINMAIGIRTIYALASYSVRKGLLPIPGVSHTTEGYNNGTSLFYTLMWGVVMWHWRHEAPIFSDEMNKAQVSQMDFIYNDFPLREGWTNNTHLLWFAVLIAFKNIL